MKRAWTHLGTKTQLIGMISIFLQSCGFSPVATTSVSCPTGQAQIEIYDTFVRRTCGCTETSGTLFNSSQTFTCTAKVGTVFVLYYLNVQQNHSTQILGGTGSALANNGATQLYSIQATTTAGSPFNFSDNTSGVTGTITVTP